MKRELPAKVEDNQTQPAKVEDNQTHTLPILRILPQAIEMNRELSAKVEDNQTQTKNQTHNQTNPLKHETYNDQCKAFEIQHSS
jgi:hypothetical protein